MSGAEGPLRIAVAGGSIGGLCAGLALRGAGFDVQVYERISGPMETRGAGIVVQGELIDLLRTHGANTLPTTRCRVRRYLSAEGGDGKVQRAPQEFTSWEAIYRTLVDAFPSDRYHRGAMLTDFGGGKGAVRADIDGHGVVEADVLKLTLPPATYVVFAHDGHVTQIRETYEAIWNNWFPKSGKKNL
jgi:2-polyprenyl-6-methoxyphenol hydroxylase-like FAD-dependent oxidoreductase